MKVKPSKIYVIWIRSNIPLMEYCFSKKLNPILRKIRILDY